MVRTFAKGGDGVTEATSLAPRSPSAYHPSQHVMRLSLPVCLALGATAFACANEAPTVVDGGERAKTLAVITVDRSEPATLGSPGSASAIARFVSVPEFSDAARLLVASGAIFELPAPGTCQAAEGADELDGTNALLGPVEFVEAGEVTLSASGVTTPLVPHAFPAVGTFASGVLYTTRDRESGALPSGVPYFVSVTGSQGMNAVRTVAEAPAVPAHVRVGGAALGDVDIVRADRAIDVSWERGDAADIVYVELLSYDGSPTTVCSFGDQVGTGTIAAGTFAGAGAGRIAVHRLRQRHIGAASVSAGEIRFDFQVGASVEFSR